MSLELKPPRARRRSRPARPKVGSRHSPRAGLVATRSFGAPRRAPTAAPSDTPARARPDAGPPGGFKLTVTQTPGRGATDPRAISGAGVSGSAGPAIWSPAGAGDSDVNTSKPGVTSSVTRRW